MRDQRDLFGTPAHHLVRREGPDTSREAAELLDSAKLEGLVFRTVWKIAPCISDEVRAQHPGTCYSSITARFRALLDKDLIIDTGVRRQGRSGRLQRVVDINPELRKIKP